jgi:hypothetical protein
VAIGPDRKTYLYPLAGGEPTVVPGIEVNDVVAGFVSDSRSVFVYRRGELPTNVSRLDVTTGQRTPWRSLFPADPGGVGTMSPIPSPSGDSYVYSYERTLSDLYLSEGFN